MQSNSNPGPVGKYKLAGIYNSYRINTNITKRRETNTIVVKYKFRPSWRVKASLDIQFSQDKHKYNQTQRNKYKCSQIQIQAQLESTS